MPISSTLNGYPILLRPPDLDASATSRAATVATDDFEGDAGDMLAIKAAGLPSATEEITFVCKTRAELDDLESFCRSLKGMWQAFWIPTWNDDVTVLVPGGSSRIIRDIDYTASLFPNKAFTYIHVVDQTDWQSWCLLSVGSSVNNGDGTETLSGSYDVSGTFDGATSATHRFMFLRFVRLSSDDVQIEYLDGDRAIVKLEITNVPSSNPQFNLPAGFTPIELTNVVSPYDATKFIASLRGTPPGDGAVSVVADPGVLPTCGSVLFPDSTVNCAIVVTAAPARIWRTEPVDDLASFAPIVFSALAGNGGGTYDRYSRLHLGFTFRHMRDVLGTPTEIASANSNFRPTDWSGGVVWPSTAAVSLLVAAGDWFEFELNGMAGLHSGYVDTGNRPGIIHGSPYRAYAYIYGPVRPEVP